MKTNDDDIKYPIPEKFRVSMDVTDEAAHALLLECDKQQAELGARINAPFVSNTPQERARSKAAITLQAFAASGVLPEQAEVVAEAHAAMGRYDLAAEASVLHKDLYEKYWGAVFRPDSEWCPHPDKHKYTKENIFSINHGKEMPLLACNICDMWNVADEPGHLTAARAVRSQVREASKSMDPVSFQQYMQSNFRAK